MAKAKAAPKPKKATALAEIERAIRAGDAATIAAAVPRLRTKTDRRKVLQQLLAVAEPWATDCAIDLLREPDYDLSLEKASNAACLQVWERLVDRLDEVLIAEEHAFYALAILSAVENADTPDAIRKAFAAALLPHATTLPTSTRDRVIRLLWDAGTADDRARLEAEHEPLAFPLRARAMLDADAGDAYQQLATSFRESPARRDMLLELLDADSDPRWAHEVLVLAPGSPMLATSVLVRMRAADELCDLAARPEFDDISRYAVHGLAQLGDPRASRLLLDWLQQPSGQARAPMILTALGACGDAEAAATLQTELPTAGTRRAFYELAIAEIRERLHPTPAVTVEPQPAAKSRKGRR